MNRISFGGIILGNFVDIVSTNVVMLPVMIYIVASSAPGSLSDQNAFTEILRGSTAYLVSSSVLGGLCSVLGGYVSARIAKRDEALNGSLSSILCIGSGVYALVSGSAADHLWLHLAFLPLSPALGAFGGFLRSWQIAPRG